MTELRAPDVKDEHGWRVVNAEDEVIGHGASRDKARAMAREAKDAQANGAMPEWVYGLPPEALSPEQARAAVIRDLVDPEDITVLPGDNSPEAVAAHAANEVSKSIKFTLSEMKTLWVKLAGDLYVFKESRMWEHLGLASFEEYIADPDIGMELRYAFDLIAAYKQLVIDRGVDPQILGKLHVTKVRVILPAIRQEQVSVEEAFADAEALPRRDLYLKYSGQASSTPGKPDTGTRVDTDSEPSWGVCPTCGTRRQVHPESGEFLR